MREKLNANPMLQVGLIAVMGIAVAFLLFTRVMSRGAEADPAATLDAPPSSEPSADGTAPPVDPAADTAPTLDPAVVAAGDPAIATGKFVAGPGLPSAVAHAYDEGKAIALLIIREHPRNCFSAGGADCAGLADRRVEPMVDALSGPSNVEVFVTHAAGIARYSRITSGVEVDRTPALVLIRPRRFSEGTPEASVSYGFRGRESVEQALDDALYQGSTNGAYHPE